MLLELERVRDGRLIVLAGEEPADGWSGKNWACHQLSHAAVRDSVVDDIDVARRVARAGLACRIMDATGIVTCRMYRSGREAADVAHVPIPAEDDPVLGGGDPIVRRRRPTPDDAEGTPRHASAHALVLVEDLADVRVGRDQPRGCLT